MLWSHLSLEAQHLSPTSVSRLSALVTCRSDVMDCGGYQTWNWVIGSPGQWVIWVIFHVRVTKSSFWSSVRPEFFPFSKKAQDKDIKIYIFVKIRPSVLEILTFNKWSSKFYFPEVCKRQTAIKLANLLPTANACLQRKSTYGVHYRTGSPDQLGLRVAGFRVTGSLGHEVWPSSMSGMQWRVRCDCDGASWRRYCAGSRRQREVSSAFRVWRRRPAAADCRLLLLPTVSRSPSVTASAGRSAHCPH